MEKIWKKLKNFGANYYPPQKIVIPGGIGVMTTLIVKDKKEIKVYSEDKDVLETLREFGRLMRIDKTIYVLMKED